MLTKRKKQAAITLAQRHAKDTGSAEVQISLLTKRIEDLASHLKDHQKDKHSRRGLLQLVADRHSLVRYLRKADEKKLKAISKKVGIKV